MSIHEELLIDLIYKYNNGEYMIWSLVCKKWHRVLSTRTQKKTYRKSVIYDIDFFIWSEAAIGESDVCKHICTIGLLPQLQHALKVNSSLKSRSLGCIASENMHIHLYKWLQEEYSFDCDHCLNIMLQKNETEIYARHVKIASDGDMIHIIYKNNISLFTLLLSEQKIRFSVGWTKQLFKYKHCTEYLELINSFKKLSLSDELALAYGAVEENNLKGLEWMHAHKYAWDRQLRNYASRKSCFMDICVWIQKKGWP